MSDGTSRSLRIRSRTSSTCERDKGRYQVRNEAEGRARREGRDERFGHRAASRTSTCETKREISIFPRPVSERGNLPSIESLGR